MPLLVADDEATKSSHLALVVVSLKELELALELPGIETPEQMYG